MAIKNVRTIKRLRELVDSSTTDVANFNFRSLEEVQQFLTGVAQKAKDFGKQLTDLENNFEAAAIKSGRFTIDPRAKKEGYKPGSVKKEKPTFVFDVTKLEKAFNVVDEIHDKVEAMDAVINNLALNFKGTPGTPKLISDAKKIRTTLQGHLDKAYRFLTETATKHEPEKFVKIVTTILDDVLKTFNGDYEKYKQTVYVVPFNKGGEGVVLFSRYVEFQNFANDDGTIYPKVYLVFNCMLDDQGNQQYSVNSFREFSPPGKATRGAEFTNVESGRIKAYIELEHHNFSTMIERIPVPAEGKELQAVNWGVPKDWIKSVKVEENVIDFRFTSSVTVDNKDKALSQLMVDLKTFFSSRIKANISPKPYKIGRTFGVEFILTLPDNNAAKKQMRIDAHSLKYLQNKLMLSDRQAVGLVKYLNQLADDENGHL